MGNLHEKKQKEQNQTLNKSLSKDTYKTAVKSSLPADNPRKDAQADDFVSYTTVPQSAMEKNGGILGFFKKSTSKKDINYRGDTENAADQSAQVNKQTTTTRTTTTRTTTQAAPKKAVKKNNSASAIVDLTEKERGGASVMMMRDSKAFLAEKAETDLKAERKTPLSDFIKNMLNDLITLGKTDASMYAKAEDKIKARDREAAAAKKCIPFLLEFQKNTDHLEVSPEDKAFAEKYQKLYGHISSDEKNLLRAYSEHLRSLAPTLDTTGVKQTIVKDSNIEVPAKKSVNTKINGQRYTSLSGVKFETRDDPLFSHQPCIYDMRQGDMKNCYMISALISIVGQNPQAIKDCMKDNGDTVTVRFFKGNKPVYINVQKSLPYREYSGKDKSGNTVTLKEYYGNKGALWVNMIEKAYAVFSGGKSYLGLEEGGSDGSTIFISHLTGRKATGLALPGDFTSTGELENQLPKKRSIRSILHDMRKNDRAKFEEELRKQNKLPSKKKERNRLWNRQKAKLYFGLKDNQITPEIEELFRKNTAHTMLRKYLEKKLKDNFTDDGLRTLTEFQSLLHMAQSVEIKKILKDLNLPQIDSKFMGQLFNHIYNTEPLYSIMNNYKYSDEENDTYKQIQKAKSSGKYITTGTSRLRFQMQKNTRLEAFQAGIYGNHAYGVLGCEEKEILIKGKKTKRKFVILANPWQHSARLYNSNGIGYGQSAEYDEKGNTTYDDHGIFLMELRDFRSTFSSVDFQ